MLIAFIIAMLTLSIIIWAVDNKTKWSRYVSGIALMGAVSGISDEITNLLIPFLKKNMLVSSVTINNLYRFHAFLTQLCEHAGVFLAAMYCISYSKLFSKSQERLAAIFIFTVAAISFFRNPWLTTDEQIAANLYRPYYLDLSIWGAPFLTAGLIFLFIAYFKEKNPGIIRQRFINLMIATPIILSIMFNLIIFRAAGLNHNMSKINMIIMLIVIVIFIIMAIRNGALGLRIRFDRQSVAESIDTISEGTAIINHMLKNEVGKLALASVNINNMLTNGKIQPDFSNINMEVINNSLNNLNVMINKMQNFSGNINIQNTLCNIEEIINAAISNISIFLNDKAINLIRDYSYKIQVECDITHMIEALTNILKNACEVLNPGQTISVSIYGNKKILYISINDNGPGIRKEYISKVLEPFFTTKEGSKNFGFGLSYAYKVLNKHDGDLTIYSKENVGTTVILSLPSYRIKCYDKNLPLRSK